MVATISSTGKAHKRGSVSRSPYHRPLAKQYISTELSRGLWSEIEQDPTQLLDRLTLGGDGRYWGVMLTGTREEPFGNIGGVFSAKFYAAVENFSSYEEVRFVALGCEGDWAFGDGSMTSIRGSASLGNAAKLAHQQNRAILVGSFTKEAANLLITCRLDRASSSHPPTGGG